MRNEGGGFAEIDDEVAKVEASYTGQYLGPVIERTKKFMGLK